MFTRSFRKETLHTNSKTVTYQKQNDNQKVTIHFFCFYLTGKRVWSPEQRKRIDQFLLSICQKTKKRPTKKDVVNIRTWPQVIADEKLVTDKRYCMVKI